MLVVLLAVIYGVVSAVVCSAGWLALCERVIMRCCAAGSYLSFVSVVVCSGWMIGAL